MAEAIAHSTPVLNVDRLCVQVRQPDRSSKRVVDDVSFAVPAGKVTALVGESGSGKTMIGRALMHLLPPAVSIERGSVRFQGRELLTATPKEMRAVRGREIGMVFQEPMVSLNPALTVGFQMMEGLRLHFGLSQVQAKERCLAMLERVRIADPSGCFVAYPHEYSGGMRQRIMLASVLVMEPKLLIADEPTTALDALIQKEVMDILVELTNALDTSVLLVSHDLGLVGTYADDAVVLRGGRVLEAGPTRRILAGPRHEYTRNLLDSLPERSPRPAVRSAEVLIDVRSLRVEYREKARTIWRRPNVVRAVENASLTVLRGETLAIVGESGSGKTTIARALARLLQEQSGSIHFEGVDITALRGRSLLEYRLHMQMVFQDPFSSLDPRIRLLAIVAEGLRNSPGLTAAERRNRAGRMLAEVGLPGDFSDRYPHELSGGQRQRVCIARALVGRPKILIADEPMAALDVTIQRQILGLIGRLQQQLGFACLFISHDLGVVEQIADRVLVMYRGTILEVGSRDAIFDDPRHPYTVQLLQATPRLRRSESGYRFESHHVSSPSPPRGYAYFTRGSTSGTHACGSSPVWLPVAEDHIVACSTDLLRNSRYE